ncbi:MAG: ABC transporter substrate-binding protein [Proteobacteria bacterium]|nr:ABC transporter substrate-binding protein [Pseudomonadota bacterium]
MHRRSFLAGSAATLAMPAIVRAQSARVIRFIPESDIVIFDPVVTPSAQTREHAYLIYDTLFGLDDQYRPQLQMLEGYTVENEGKLWRLTLRDGLKFHDGERVLARDCVASIKRWGVRDTFGQALMAATDEIVAANDKTIEVRLKRPFPLLPDALGKTMAYMCPIMPERIAKTDPFQAITDPTGSGPYKYVANERVPGSRVVYQRFADYVPRKDGVPQTTAGPKITHFDRVEWSIIQEPGTAALALQRAEVDWLQTPNPDLLPALRANKNIVVKIISPTGLVAYMRFNQLLPPFDNPAMRRALLGAVTQSDYMIGINGADKTLWRDGVGYFLPGSPLANDAGMAALTGPRDLAKVKADLAAAGYKGEKIAMMVATDVSYLRIMGDITADLSKKIGLNVEYQAIDWTTVVQRRSKMDPIDQGGWNLFCINDNGVNQLNPASHLWLRGNGKAAAPGWPTSPALESLRDRWLQAADLEAQKKIAVEMQLQAFQDVPYIPLGQSIAPTAHRSDIVGVLNGQPTFWNVRRST